MDAHALLQSNATTNMHTFTIIFSCLWALSYLGLTWLITKDIKLRLMRIEADIKLAKHTEISK